MRLVKTSIIKKEGKVKIEAEIESSVEVIKVWFEIPLEHEKYLSNDGNHWLIIMTALSFERDDPVIELDLPVDDLLVRNMIGINAIWRKWFGKEIKPLKINADNKKHFDYKKRDTGLFFSGGVDSMFSFFNNETNKTAWSGIDDFITVWGFDIPLNKKSEFDLLFRRIENTAQVFEKKAIQVTTNLRDYEPFYQTWGSIGHGAGLLAIAQLLSNKISTVLLGSTFEYAEIIPRGSHPLTDPLFGSQNLLVVHDGAAFTRLEKIQLLSKYPNALAQLHVCYDNWDSKNCSACNKCIRTMLAIMATGTEKSAKSFDFSNFNVAKSPLAVLKNPWDIKYFQEIIDYANDIGRVDIVDYCQDSISFSVPRQSLLKYIEYMQKIPFIWRFKHKLKRIVVKQPRRC
jgi:hypothetical protein